MFVVKFDDVTGMWKWTVTFYTDSIEAGYSVIDNMKTEGSDV